MNEKTSDLLNDKKFYRFVLGKSEIIEIIDYLVKDLLSNESSSLLVELKKRSANNSKTSSKAFEIEVSKINDDSEKDRKINKFKNEVDNFFDRETFNTLFISYRKDEPLYRKSDIKIRVMASGFFVADFEISSPDDEWYNSKINGLSRIFEKGWVFDYYAVIGIPLMFLLAIVIINLKLFNTSNISIDWLIPLSLLQGTLAYIIPFNIHKLIRSTCFPCVEFSTEKNHFKRNRKWLWGILGFNGLLGVLLNKYLNF